MNKVDLIAWAADQLLRCMYNALDFELRCDFSIMSTTYLRTKGGENCFSFQEDVDATEDVLDKNEDFKSLDFEEMKDILRQNLMKCNKLMVDTDYKLKIALSFNPEDKELKKMIEERNNVFLDFFKVEDNNENLEGEEIDGDKNENTNENPLEKGYNVETKGEEIGSEEVEGNKDNCEENKGNEEQQETYGESNEDESQNEAKHNESESIDNIGNLSLSTGQNTNRS
ncbi:hypothetical protein Tco_0527042 [Tanacetum coccineum]